jgi:hypothetical protein
VTDVSQSVACGDCGAPIDESPSTPGDEREPCPNCGSTNRSFSVQIDEVLRAVDAVSGEVAEVSEEVDTALTGVRLAVLATLLTLAATAGLSAGFAEHSVALGLLWGIGAVVLSVLILVALFRVGPIRRRVMAVMDWLVGS